MKNSFTLKITTLTISVFIQTVPKMETVSCAAIQHNTKITKRLPSSISIYSAESKAIDLALNIITQTESTKFIIFFCLFISLNIPKKPKPE